jgi:hypothetical protein
MRDHLIIGALLLLFAATAFGVPDGDPLPTADAVVAKMLVRDAQRQALIAGYRGNRRYVLDNKRMQKHAEILVRVKCDADGTKHFEVVDEQGWKAAQKHVLQKMLESEAEASRPQMRMKTRLSPDNYEFHMVRSELLDGRMAYAIDIVPKRREERLFAGRIWIDAEDYALVRAEGKPAKNPSFWTRSVHFVHRYQKSGTFWFPVSTESVTEVRFLGSTSVTIDYFDYAPNPLHGTETAGGTPRGPVTQ